MEQQPQYYNELTHLLSAHLEPLHSGKVRDSYRIPSTRGRHPLRLVVTSDRVSIFDFMLGFELPGKGEILNAFNIAARNMIRKEFTTLEQDLVAYGKEIDAYLPIELRNCPTLQRRAVVVEEVPMLLVECVARGNLTGTGYKAYLKTGSVCGHVLSPGLVEGAALSKPLFTPTTKASEGHDVDLHYKDVQKKYPGLGSLMLNLFGAMRRFAARADIILVDQKCEFGGLQCSEKPKPLRFVLADEVMTPDSCRFWDREAYETAMAQGKLPPSMDKQILRNWGAGVGISKRDPLSSLDRAWVRTQFPPPQVIYGARRQTLRLFRRLHGVSVREYQKTVMGVS